MIELLTVITITILAVISPGPDFAMVTRNSLVLSRRAGVLTAIGIGLGVLVHVTYTILGLGLLIKQSLWLFNSIKLAGTAYLIYLGIKMLRAKSSDTLATSGTAALSGFAALRTGFFTNALNPKTTIFVVSLFMQVVQPATPFSVQVGYGVFISLAHMVWFTLVALVVSSGLVRARLLAMRHWIDRVFGAMLVGLGMLLAMVNVSR